MVNIYKIVSKLPVSKRIKLEWQRSLLERAFASELALARKKNDKEKVQELRHDHEYEMDMHREEEDQYYTASLLRQARMLRVPIPKIRDESDVEMDDWYQGHYTGVWLLTNSGISNIRKEIRVELKERHEARSRWVVWVSALTGVIGATTGLAAILSKIFV